MVLFLFRVAFIQQVARSILEFIEHVWTFLVHFYNSKIGMKVPLGNETPDVHWTSAMFGHYSSSVVLSIERKKNGVDRRKEVCS